ncbi:ParA family protein [Gluconobacter kondonii]|uniref:Chromosome partitioning protein ParA n=1 Tax=Gluconobacter kondonii TaxID=941463 RepID=A0ABQ5WV55_9PROT|nr:ParA family protein [Gluconobacter kondonii]GBR41741.1 cobyrinic acid ac-diamide synthase [Gluconobacter kondonii NBRC 3266]GLQ67440.1 chromosome partitioning protein ParA [Gluconobacter kondonii]
MPILTIASFKGGPGKTTLCQIIAAQCATDGLSVAVIDADPTKAMSDWHKNTYEGAPFTCIAETSERTIADLALGLDDKSDLVLIDTAGFGNLAGAVAMTVADHILVPLTAGAADLNQAEETIKQAKGLATAARRKIEVRAIMNRLSKTNLTKHAERELREAGIPTLEATISHRTAFGEISYSGEIPSKGSAAAEVTMLINELKTIGWIPRSSAASSHNEVEK